MKLNGSVTPENVGEMDRLYAIARQLDVPMHMDAYMMPGGAGATALTERTAGTARLPWARWAAGIRTAGSSGSELTCTECGVPPKGAVPRIFYGRSAAPRLPG